MVRFGSFATAAAALALATGAHAANLVADGDFSSPSGGSSFTTVSGGSAIGPWNVTGDSVDLIGGYWQAPTAGGGSVDLDGDAPGGIWQSLGVLPTGHYVLSFYMSGNPDGAPNPKTLDVSVDQASEVLNPASGADHTDMNYKFETLNFFSNGNTPTIVNFSSGDVGTPYGPVIGGVSVTSAVPEPAVWSMLILGLFGLGTTLRSNRKAQAAPIAA